MAHEEGRLKQTPQFVCWTVSGQPFSFMSIHTIKKKLNKYTYHPLKIIIQKWTLKEYPKDGDHGAEMEMLMYFHVEAFSKTTQRYKAVGICMRGSSICLDHSVVCDIASVL